MQAILNPEQEDLLTRTRDILGQLRDVLTETAVSPENRSALIESIRQLDELFMLVVTGEFNAGKSAFVNALLGQSLLPEGVTPTTSQIYLLKYGEKTEQTPVETGVWTQTAPVDILHEIVIVDTPGTNAILREHEALTAEFIPRSDLVLFITSADRPFTESERAFLTQIRDWGKKIVLVVNKIDILPGEAEREQVITFVTDSARKLVGDVQAVFPTSAKLAQEAKAGQPEKWGSSGFEPLESYIHETLDDNGRFRLKLSNPLGVGQKLVKKQLNLVEADLHSLKEDRDLLDDINGQMVYYNDDMQRNFQARLGEIDNILWGMEKRGNNFFDEMIRFGRIPDLISTRKVEAAFEEEVIADAPEQIDSHVSELIDWMVEQDLRQWTAVADHMAKRKQIHQERIVGEGGPREGSLAYNRQHLIDSIGKSTRLAVETYDNEKEAAELAEAARGAVVNTGLAGVGVGIGVAIAAAAHVVWIDVTGISAALLAAALGLLVLPARRRKGKKELQEKLAELRHTLVNSLTRQFDREMRHSTERIEDTVAPFTRFVRAETDKLTAQHDTLVEIEAHIIGLQGQINTQSLTEN
ncbi:MAG: dynamin [Chloroflexi bacterium]|nr:MAG: dynamin [Chloroflexota bacterium]PIE80515.1 MAG: dynamin [Chloroflexota bacterium]